MSVIRQRRLRSRLRRCAAAAAVAVISTLAVAGSASLAGSPAGGTASYQGSPIGVRVLGTSASWGHVHASSAASTLSRAKGLRYTANRAPANSSGNAARALAPGGSAPVAAASAISVPKTSLVQNFDGLSDTQNKAIAGFHDTPPDQGLCVGNLDGFGGQVVIEVVNSIFGIYTPSGTLLSSFTLSAGFFDPNAFSDPRCFWDPTTSSFYMTVISCSVCGPPGTADSVDDVLVVGQTGSATTYQYDTSVGGTCFGDQPHTGYDGNALYVATDEFCGSDGSTYSGALLIAISKSQLAAHLPTPNAVSFGLLSLGGVPILTLEPAFGGAGASEYLLNAFPYDRLGNNNPTSNSLGLWTVTGDANITSGSGTTTLTGKIIGSETYAFPVPAASTGDGTTPSGSPPFVISEQFLNPDDSRMLQVQFVGPHLYASLSSAINIPGDPTTRDGAAWFVIDPKNGKITKQGYLGVAGAYLLYPSILHSARDTTAMAFTLTSSTINPSAAYAVANSGSYKFGSVQVAGTGTAAHVSFSDVLFGRGRWGDYSALQLDPNGTDIWSATEYIGGNGSGDLVDNWGTRIWDVERAAGS